jgi:hypothetical protein
LRPRAVMSGSSCPMCDTRSPMIMCRSKRLASRYRRRGLRLSVLAHDGGYDR